MPDLNVLFKKLSSSSELKEFKLKNKEAFLYACFFVSDGSWQFDYFNPKNKFVTTFEVSDVVKVMPVDRASGDNKKILELDLSKVKVDFDNSLDIVNKFVASHYSDDNFFSKTIVILQNFDGKIIWNVTFLTSTLKLLNIKLDASSGEVLSHCIESFLRMQ